MKTRITTSIVHWTLLAAALIATPFLQAQTPAAAKAYLGTVTSISGTTVTVKTDAGEVHAVEVPEAAAIKRIAPGEKDLNKAVAIQFSNLATGDRVLVRLDPNAPAGTTQASQVITVKAADLAEMQQKEREDWARNGVGGLVKSVDSASGNILVTTGAGQAVKTITIHTTPATVLKRYAPASVRFDLAQPGPITAIQPGDQLRARGTKSADGTEIAAVEVVSGGFRNISGTITSIDTAGSTLAVKDLLTKKPVTIHITADAQMRKLPDRMAQMLAARLNGGAGGGGGRGAGQGGGQAPLQGGGSTAGPGGGTNPNGPGPGGPGGGLGGDPQQMLSRAPTIKLADLQKGDAVMLVATQGTSDVTAITLVAGVEPLLEAPAASNLLSNWSMGGGAPEGTQ
jgi:hypothetical protein